jgi:hypothetical protein
MKARLELTEVAESTLREQLERERQRADQEHREREQAQEEVRTLRKELEGAREVAVCWSRIALILLSL